MSAVVFVVTLIMVPLVIIVMAKSAILVGKWLWDNAVPIMILLILVLFAVSLTAEQRAEIDKMDHTKTEYAK